MCVCLRESVCVCVCTCVCVCVCVGALCLSPGFNAYSDTKPEICLTVACRGRSGTVYGGNNVIRVAGNVTTPS